MVANPTVNQGAAVLLTSLAAARAAGIAEDRIVHIRGGASAEEPRDYLERDQYVESHAQTAVLQAAKTTLPEIFRAATSAWRARPAPGASSSSPSW